MRQKHFLGPLMLGAGTIGVIVSAPGQTAGVSAFTDFLIADLGIGRSALSLAYLVGTLGSAALLSVAGRLYDRFGARVTATASALLLSSVLLMLAASPGVLSALGAVSSGLTRPVAAGVIITFLFFLLRFSGQGMLTLASRNMVMEWYQRRRGRANAVMGISVAFAFSLTPGAFTLLIRSVGGWQQAWRLSALVLAVFGGFAALVYRWKPEVMGQLPDGDQPGDAAQSPESGADQRGFTLAEARRTWAFWGVALSLLLAGLLVTGYTFHVVDVFAQAGRSRVSAVRIFLPVSVVAVVIQALGNWASDRISLKYIAMALCAGIILISVGIILLEHNLALVLLVGGQGLVEGCVAVLSVVTWPRYFGRAHLGAISGFAAALAVFGTSLGPGLLSLSLDATGSYGTAAGLTAALAMVLLVGSFRIRVPELG